MGIGVSSLLGVNASGANAVRISNAHAAALPPETSLRKVEVRSFPLSDQDFFAILIL